MSSSRGNNKDARNASEYEQQKFANVERNQMVMESLNINSLRTSCSQFNLGKEQRSG